MEQENKQQLSVAEIPHADQLPVKKKYIPPAAGMGRVKGSKNKYTVAIKSMVEEALSKAGGVDYLVRQAEENPVAFMGLVGKLMPKNVTADVGIEFKGLAVHVIKQ